jgi:hypothetical protein
MEGVYKIVNFTGFVSTMVQTGNSATIQNGKLVNAEVDVQMGSENAIQLTVTQVPGEKKYVFKLTQDGNQLKVERCETQEMGGFSCMKKSSHIVFPLPSELGVQKERTMTLKERLQSIITKSNTNNDFYLKINASQLGIDTTNNTKITNVIADNLTDQIDEQLKEKIPQGGSKKTSSKKLTKEKVKYNGRNHSVYVGPKGGKYIKTNGQFVSFSRLNL